MLLSHTIEKKKNNNIIFIPIEKISKWSRVLVDVSCDYCGIILNIPYYRYIEYTKVCDKYSCSKKDCSNKKIKEVNLIKYGVDSPMKLQSTKDKLKKSTLDKYGVENVFQSEIIKEKSKKTVLDKYGVDNIMKLEENIKKVKKTNLEKYGNEHPSKLDFFKEKSKETKLEKYGNKNYNNREKNKKTVLDKYGVENVFQSEIIKEKSKKTSIEKYNTEYYNQTNEFREKSKLTNLKKYGVDNYTKSDEFKERVKLTNLEKYGVEHYNNIEKSKKTILDKYGVDNIMHSEEFRKDNFKISKNINYLKHINGNISLFKCDSKLDHNFEISSDLYLSRIKYNTPLCTICYPIGYNKSIKEKEVVNYIEGIKNIICNYKIGNRKIQIDVFIPELKFGIEFNGLYWHSEIYKNKNYHLDKLEYFKENGIDIIHIWEDDWDNKKDIVKSVILNKLGQTENKIYARKCEIKEVKPNEARIFLDENHIQGFVKSNLKFGLYYKDQLVSLMSFDHFEGRKKMENDEWNLNRFCTKLNTNVIGGASKLLKYFIDNYNPLRIVSYADKDLSNGSLYKILGFNKVYESKPDYKYIINNKRIHKSNFKNSKTGISEKNLNILKVYDCGKIKYELKFNI